MHVPGTQRSVLKGFASNGTVQNGFATNGNNTKWTAQSSHCMMLIIIIVALYLQDDTPTYLPGNPSEGEQEEIIDVVSVPPPTTDLS